MTIVAAAHLKEVELPTQAAAEAVASWVARRKKWVQAVEAERNTSAQGKGTPRAVSRCTLS